MESIENKQITEGPQPNAGEEISRQPAGQERPTNGTPSEIESPEDLTESKIRHWLEKRSYSEKLTAVILNHLGIDDHGTKQLWEDIMQQYQNDIVCAANDPNQNLTHEEVLLTGLALELFIWRKHY